MPTTPPTPATPKKRFPAAISQSDLFSPAMRGLNQYGILILLAIITLMCEGCMTNEQWKRAHTSYVKNASSFVIEVDSYGERDILQPQQTSTSFLSGPRVVSSLSYKAVKSDTEEIFFTYGIEREQSYKMHHKFYVIGDDLYLYAGKMHLGDIVIAKDQHFPVKPIIVKIKNHEPTNSEP